MWFMCKHIIVEMHYIYEFKKVSNSKSDLQTHEGHYQSMSFDVPYNFLLVFHCNYAVSYTHLTLPTILRV